MKFVYTKITSYLSSTIFGTKFVKEWLDKNNDNLQYTKSSCVYGKKEVAVKEIIAV